MEPIRDAIKTLADKAKAAPASHEALHYSQSALNLAHTLQVLAEVAKT